MSRKLILLSTLLLLLLWTAQHHLAAGEESTTPANSDEDDDSSSEETVEDSNESRRKRSIESRTDAGNVGGTARGIPGLPDPATIIKIAEILQAVGEKVVPILVEGNPAADLVSQRLSRDFKFLRNFKKEIDAFTGELNGLVK